MNNLLFGILCLAFLGAATASPVTWQLGDPFPPEIADDVAELPPLVILNHNDISAMCAARTWREILRAPGGCEQIKTTQYNAYLKKYDKVHERINQEIADRRQAQEAAEARLRRDEQIAEQKAKDAAFFQHWAEKEKERQRQIDEDQKRYEEEERQARKADAAREVARKKADAEKQLACGADYRALRVGMTVVQAQECVAPFKKKGQLARADGVVVDSYRHCVRYRCTELHVIDGLIAAWYKD